MEGNGINFPAKLNMDLKFAGFFYFEYKEYHSKAMDYVGPHAWVFVKHV